MRRAVPGTRRMGAGGWRARVCYNTVALSAVQGTIVARSEP